MQTLRNIAGRRVTLDARRADRATRPRVCVSVTVALEDAEPLRRALFCRLYGHIKRVVVVRDAQDNGPASTAALQIVLDSETIDEALGVVQATADCAGPAQVRCCC